MVWLNTVAMEHAITTRGSDYMRFISFVDTDTDIIKEIVSIGTFNYANWNRIFIGQ